MTAVCVLLVVLLVSVVCLAWPEPGESWKWPHRSRDEKQPARPAPAAAPTSLEGVLAAQLIEHEISQAQYRRAVERLARYHDEAHPFAAPDDNPPTAGH